MDEFTSQGISKRISIARLNLTSTILLRRLILNYQILMTHVLSYGFRCKLQLSRMSAYSTRVVLPILNIIRDGEGYAYQLIRS
jgi:hypothetical protein